MNPLTNLVNGLTAQATTAATSAASDAAAAQWEIYKPYVYFATFLAATVYLFYFLPRFASPFKKIN